MESDRLYAPQDGGSYPHSGGQMVALDIIFPGYSILAETMRQSLGIDLGMYIPFMLILGITAFLWTYIGEYVGKIIKTSIMSTAQVLPDDEIYNVVMTWVAGQPFGTNSRHFIVNLDLSSSVWSPWAWKDEDEDSNSATQDDHHQHKTLQYTPSFGFHLFWYKGRPILFRRAKREAQGASVVNTKLEEVSLWCFGYSPAILKDLLQEAHMEYLKRDNKMTMIYRGNLQPR